jgi:hypothetical protein
MGRSAGGGSGVGEDRRASSLAKSRELERLDGDEFILAREEVCWRLVLRSPSKF